MNNNYSSSLNWGGNNLNLIRINSLNEYKNIIQNSTLDSNIVKSNFNTWHHIWSALVNLHGVFRDVDVGHLNQNNNSKYFIAIYWSKNSSYSTVEVDKISSEYLRNDSYANSYINGGACFRPIIEFKE